jgi:hypothetical protein
MAYPLRVSHLKPWVATEASEDLDRRGSGYILTDARAAGPPLVARGLRINSAI